MSNSLYRKWRPQTFSDLKGQDVIRDTLVYALTHDQMSHAYLFCGPRGTGKTTTARLVAKLLNCIATIDEKPCNQCEACLTITAGTNLDVIELDGASNRGIDEIRQLRDSVKYPPTQAAYKVFIIDEVHMLTREAFNALLKTLEEPPKHVVFILATTEAHKVPSTVLSRVQRYDFRLATVDTLADHLVSVATTEKMNLTPAGARLIAKLGEGSFRDALSLLEQVKASDYPEYTIEVLEAIFGYVPLQQVKSFLESVLTGDSKEAFGILDTTLAQGADLRAFGDQVLALAQEVLEGAVLGQSGPLGVSIETKHVVEWIETWADALVQSKSCPIPRLPLDVAIAKFATSSQTEIRDKRQDSRAEPAQAETRDKIQDSSPELVSVMSSSSRSPAIAGEPTSGIQEIKGMDSRSDASFGLSVENDIVGNDDKPKSELKTRGEPVESIENSVSVPVLAEVPEHISSGDWLKMLEKIKNEAPSLLTSLAHARVFKVEHDVITLAVPYKMHAEKINSSKNREIIEQSVSAVLQVPMKVVAQVNKEAAKQADEIVDVAEVFELEL